jgi:hypothetical protein
LLSRADLQVRQAIEVAAKDRATAYSMRLSSQKCLKKRMNNAVKAFE